MPKPNQPAQTTSSPVEFIRPEVINMADIWTRIRAVTEGEDAVKALRDRILPMPNAADKSPANKERYESYIKRAVFYGVAARTLGGMAGFVFEKDPVAKLPADMQPLEENIDGSGQTLVQQAKAALRTVLAFGRAGLLVDYPETDSPVTQQDILDGSIAPSILLYQPEAIINWRVKYEGSKMCIEMIVLRETYTYASEEDEFQTYVGIQYRVMMVDEATDEVHGRIFRKDSTHQFVESIDLAYSPKDNKGNPLTEIPFTFLGAINNDPAIDTPPLLDMVNLNIAHFRNSADHEEACFLVGQPTPWISGMTKVWVDEVLGGKVCLGSRAVIPLPQGGSAGLLQATPNGMPIEAMKHKEEQMIALGAKLMTAQQGGSVRTATQVHIDHAAEVSVLLAAAQNIFIGYKKALEFAGLFTGSNTASIDFDLAEPLTQDTITPLEAQAIATTWMQGLIDYEEARWKLKKAGWAWKDDQVVLDNNAAHNFDANLINPATGNVETVKGKPIVSKPAGSPPFPPPQPAK